MNSNKITNLATPTATTDLATKLYTETPVKHYIRCENTVFGNTTTNLNVADPARAVVQITGSSTIVGDFSVNGNGIQCDFNGVVYFMGNVNTEIDGAGSRQVCAINLQRTRSAVTTDIGTVSICGFIRNTSGMTGTSYHLTEIQSVQNGDVFELVSHQYAADVTPVYLAAAGTSNFCALRIG